MSTHQPQDPAVWSPVEQLLARHAACHPLRDAIVDVDRDVAIGFGELARVVDGVALQLRARGIGHGSRVVLLIDGGVETVVIWCALWRLAAVVCPFDISQIGATSTQEAFNTLRPALLLHGRRIADGDIPPGTAPRLQFGQWPSLAHDTAAIRMLALPQGDTLQGPGAALHDVAAACSTSGTGGRMKIVLHDHASYWLNGQASRHLLALTEADRMLDYRSLSWFSPQILSLMPFLQLGMTLHLARQFSASRFPDWLAHHRITVSTGVPTVLNMLLNRPLDRLRECATGLRVMSSSSAPLALSTWKRFERKTRIPVMNLYGSSEGGWICGNRPGDRALGTVGKPVPGITLDIVDAQGAPCAVDEPGEVVIDGEKLALGMVEADGSLRPIRGARLSTRDLAVRGADGFVRLLGRLDDLVIRGGVKISPGEIDDALLGHPAVAEAATVGVPDAIYGQEAICFVVLREGMVLADAVLHAWAAGMLPREKRPKAVCVIDTLPRNARGKLRRDALQARWMDLVAESPTRGLSPAASPAGAPASTPPRPAAPHASDAARQESP